MYTVRRYLLMHGNHKTKVEFAAEDADATVTGEAIRKKAASIFGLDEAACLLQVWDNGFEEWMNLEDTDELETNTKVMVVAKKTNILSPSCTLPSCSSASLSELSV